MAEGQNFPVIEMVEVHILKMLISYGVLLVFPVFRKKSEKREFG
jgi:hypothetical protein